MKPHRATLILVFGILGIIPGCLPLGICAWVMGNKDLKDMDQGLMDPSGRDTTKVGKILGIIGTILISILLVVYVLIFVFAFGVVGVSAMKQAEEAQKAGGRAPIQIEQSTPESPR